MTVTAGHCDVIGEFTFVPTTTTLSFVSDNNYNDVKCVALLSLNNYKLCCL